MENNLNENQITSQRKNFFSLPQIYSKRLIVVVLSFFLIVLSCVAAIYIYWYYYLAPEQILLRSASNFTKVSSYRFEGTIRAEYEKPESEEALQVPVFFSSAFIGSFSKTGDVPKYSISFSANAGTLNIGEFEIRKIGSSLFVLIKSLSDLGFIKNEAVCQK